jgi:hypothetical protein
VKFVFPYRDSARVRREIEVEADDFETALILAVEELHRRDPA